jgi:hypothetical protein
MNVLIPDVMFRSLIVAAAALSIALSASVAIAQRGSSGAGPLGELAGVWNGGGSIGFADGKRERVRCRANYDVASDGRAMRQALRCASDTFRFNLYGDIRVRADGEIAGSWREGSQSAAGSISGVARSGRIRAMIQGTGFAAEVTVRTDGARQQVSLSSLGDVRTVSVNLRKSP